jgi:ABC-type transport system involved in cytochrome c biogenesis permease component
MFSAILASMNRRRDRSTALIIEAALNTCAQHGVQAAAAALCAHGARRDVILRVLTLPRQRRGPGQAFDDAPSSQLQLGLPDSQT